MKAGVYRHYRTHELYRLVGQALHTETEQNMIVYTSVETGKMFVRPLHDVASDSSESYWDDVIMTGINPTVTKNRFTWVSD